uniref:Pseudouridine synthase RsuA/RluA-like domain-containing protein n=1 Tax=Chrysotila carterae TaxID=13221 RepID=A0A7S4FBP7_CHRCT
MTLLRKPRQLLLALHKPFSFLSPSTDARANKRLAIDLFTPENIAPSAKKFMPKFPLRGLLCAGRLDADSTGLMLWTNDKVLQERIIGPESNVEKEYLVRVTGHERWSEEQRESAVQLLRSGISLDGTPLQRAKARWINAEQLQITLTEGRTRQIRRMCDVIGVKVKKLTRVRIGNYRLGGLESGQWSTVPLFLVFPDAERFEAAKAATEAGRGAAPRGKQRAQDHATYSEDKKAARIVRRVDIG